MKLILAGRLFTRGVCAIGAIASAGLFLACSTSAAIPLQIGQSFTGSTYGIDSWAAPADPDGAAGPQHFVELINGRFSVYDKATGTRVQTMTDVDFWKKAGVILDSTIPSTPRLIYDHSSGRWFAVMVDMVNGANRQPSNHFLLAVSASWDPTGNWNGFEFAADPKGVNFADFPALGVDANAVYISANMFDSQVNQIGSALLSIPKPGLLATPPDITRRTYLSPLAYRERGFVLQPAISLDPVSTSECLLAVGSTGVDPQTGAPNGAHTTLLLSRVLNANNTNASLSSAAVQLAVPPYSVPFNPLQPDSSNNLDDGDNSISSSVWRVGDLIYATDAVEVAKKAAIRWYIINAVSNSLVQTGTISDDNLDLFYPSISANAGGTVVIAYNGSSTNTFISSYAVAGQVINGNLTLGDRVLIKAGTSSYQDQMPHGTSRWGDFTTTTPDPTAPSRFWTIQMIPVGPSTWATQITELITGVRLSAALVGANLVLSWPSAALKVQLQFSPELGSLASCDAAHENSATAADLNSAAWHSRGGMVFVFQGAGA